MIIYLIILNNEYRKNELYDMLIIYMLILDMENFLSNINLP